MRGIARDDTDRPTETHPLLSCAFSPIQPRRTKTLPFHWRSGYPWRQLTTTLLTIYSQFVAYCCRQISSKHQKKYEYGARTDAACTGMMRNQLFTIVDNIVHSLLGSRHALLSGEHPGRSSRPGAPAPRGTMRSCAAGPIGGAYRQQRPSTSRDRESKSYAFILRDTEAFVAIARNC
jgi:hypothetical protein